MEDYFGDPIDDSGPMKFLRDNGFWEDRWLWKTAKPVATISDKEWACLNFLADEWDHSWDFT